MMNSLKEMNMNEHIAGIDYSLTSPAICVAKIIDNDIKFENLYF